MDAIPGDFSCAGHTSVQNQTYRKFHGSGSSQLTEVICTDLLDCSGATRIDSSRIHRMRVAGSTQLTKSEAYEVNASGSFQASDCLKLGKVVTSGSSSISNCKEVGEIVASGGFSLDGSNVKGNVAITGDHSDINNSSIRGTLECAGRIVKVFNSTINQISVKPARYNFRFDFFLWGWESSSKKEQIIELSGKECRVGSVSFEEGAFGKVRLKNGATVASVTGGELISTYTAPPHFE